MKNYALIVLLFIGSNLALSGQQESRWAIGFNMGINCPIIGIDSPYFISGLSDNYRNRGGSFSGYLGADYGVRSTYQFADRWAAHFEVGRLHWRAKQGAYVFTPKSNLQIDPNDPIEVAGRVQLAIWSFQTGVSFAFREDWKRSPFLAIKLHYTRVNKLHFDGLTTFADGTFISQPDLPNFPRTASQDMFFLNIQYGRNRMIQPRLSITPLFGLQIGWKDYWSNPDFTIVLNAGFALDWWF